MNARIKKEAKALLPAFGVTVGMTLAASLIWHGEDAIGATVFLFCVGCTLMGAASFGNEFSCRTMALLLAQPVPWGRIWTEKMVVVGAAIAVAFVAWSACFTGVIDTGSLAKDDMPPAWVMVFISAGIFCSAPRLTLLAKNTLIGALSTFFFPILIWLGVALIVLLCVPDNFFTRHPWMGDFVEGHPYLIVAGISAVYCGFFFWRSYAAFINFQTVDSQAREISLPAKMEAALAWPVKRLLPGYTGTTASLLRKELLLQRPCYISAVAVCALALLAAIVQKLHPSDYTVGLLIASVVLCVGIIPLVATGLSVAEERNLGLSSWHRTLPPSLRKQWLVKVAVVLGTCVLLGVILPWLMAVAGQAMALFPDWRDTPAKPIRWLLFSITPAAYLAYFLALAIGVFASSISKSAFRAILLALTLICGIVALIFLSNRVADWAVAGSYGWHNWQDPGIRLPEQVLLGILDTEFAIGLITLGLLAYANFRVAEPAPRRAWLHSGIVLAVTAVLAITFWIAV